MTAVRGGMVGRGRLRRWWPWLALALVVLGALGVGTLGGQAPSDQERAQGLAASIRCPQCASQSVAQSETPSAKGVKVLIAERIKAGNSDEEIRDFIASRYGRDVLLDPSGKGFGALVWGLPVAGAVVALGALVARFRDWGPAIGTVTDADRTLVADALEGQRVGEPGPVAGGGPGSVGRDPR